MPLRKRQDIMHSCPTHCRLAKADSHDCFDIHRRYLIIPTMLPILSCVFTMVDTQRRRTIPRAHAPEHACTAPLYEARKLKGKPRAPVAHIAALKAQMTRQSSAPPMCAMAPTVFNRKHFLSLILAVQRLSFTLATLLGRSSRAAHAVPRISPGFG